LRCIRRHKPERRKGGEKVTEDGTAGELDFRALREAIEDGDAAAQLGVVGVEAELRLVHADSRRVRPSS
jgi:hypothetical protein